MRYGKKGEAVTVVGVIRAPIFVPLRTTAVSSLASLPCSLSGRELLPCKPHLDVLVRLATAAVNRLTTS